MKTLLLLSTMFCALSASAASLTLSSDTGNPDQRFVELADVPQAIMAIMAIMADQGLTWTDAGDGVFNMTMAAIHCDSRSNGAVDGPNSGIASQICRYDSENRMDSKKGKRLRDARALIGLLDRIENADLGSAYTDCAMGGYCGTFAQSIDCRVDTKIEDFEKGRFVCTLIDAQEDRQR